MIAPDGGFNRFRLLQVLSAAETYQRTLARQRLIPDAQRVVARRAYPLVRLLAAALLGIVAALFAVLGTFLVCNRLFHI